jgi:hypothetical protein
MFSARGRADGSSYGKWGGIAQILREGEAVLRVERKDRVVQRVEDEESGWDRETFTEAIISWWPETQGGNGVQAGIETRSQRLRHIRVPVLLASRS